ncbi:hypothetical protein ACIRD9_39135 [Streptomyces violaceus]|uniref:hypothetical protein n=1 Tax=Streptomyces violaceus TaxID=1936 RepID=UPI0037F2D99B
MTSLASARWAGSITKATNDQWALARRGQVAETVWLRGQITRIEARLARLLGARADKRAGQVRGYGSRAEWHAKARRLHALKARLRTAEADWAAGRSPSGSRLPLPSWPMPRTAATSSTPPSFSGIGARNGRTGSA